jgi:drug/metabolite transporter (DMT)-like permease
MEWYLPFTLLSGVGLLVLSTSNFITGLNDEIYQLGRDDVEGKREIIRLKLKQLKLLSTSIVLQYVSLFLFTVSSILISFLADHQSFIKVVIVLGVVLISISLAMLSLFSIKAISIRQENLKSPL